MTETIKAKTHQLRKSIVYAIAKTLTPKLYREFQNNRLQNYVGRTPRPFTLKLKQTFNNKLLTGVEIGFGLGRNAVSILKTLNIKKLYCIDPFLGKAYMDFCGCIDTYAAEFRRSYYPVLKTKSNVEFIKLPSDYAYKTLPHNLDFVYVDGLHEYMQCLRDLQNYYPLLTTGGYIGGHDFVVTYDSNIDMKKASFEATVVKAALDFALQINQAPEVSMPDFWFQKEGSA